MRIKLLIKPISVNHAYPSSRYGRRFLSAEGKLYKALIAEAALKECSQKLIGPIKIKYVFIFKDRRRRDVDDYVKLAQDSLTGIWFEDDCQIVELIARKEYSSEEYSIEIETYSD